MFLSSKASREVEQKTITGLTTLAHELVHVLQYRSLGTNNFLKLYTENYELNRAMEMKDREAYEKIIAEDVAFKVDKALQDFLVRKPEIATKLRTGQPLLESELYEVGQALNEVSVQGKFKVGFQFIQGFLVYVPVPPPN